MRVANRVLALLFGLGVGATCLLGALEATAAFVDRGPVLVPYDRWIKWAQAFRWSSPQVASLSAAVAGVGLILLVMQLLPRRPLTLRTLLEGPNVEVEVDRRALEHSLARAASGVDGVHKAGVKAGKTRVRVTIEAPAGNDNEVREAIRSALRMRLEGLRIMPPPRIAVSMRARGRAR